MAQLQYDVEHCRTKGVKRMMMRRAKLILNLLIPALWLSGSLGSFGEQVTYAAAGDPGKSLCAAGQKHDISTSASSFDQIIRRAPRRPTVQPGLEKALTPAVSAPADVRLISLSFSCLDCSRDTYGLAQSWQFRWRAALQPRAPSRVS